MNEDVKTATALAAVADEAPKHEEPAAVSATLQEPKPRAKPAAEERISQLTAERKAAEERAERAEARARELEAKAAPAKAEPAKKERPNARTWTGTQEEFDAAMDEWQRVRDAEVRAAALAEQAQAETKKSMAEMMQRITAKHPDAAEKIKSAAAIIMAKAPALVQVFVNESDAIGQLLYKLSDATVRDPLFEMAKANPGKALRTLHSMELDALSTSTEPKTEAKGEEKAPDPKPRAPKPPSEVGGRGAAGEDAATAAARDGKFGDFEAEMARRHFR